MSPNLSNTVKPGQAASRRKAAAASAKVGENAAAVATLNAADSAAAARVERLAAARVERDALQAWMAKPATERGERPATPNMDAIARQEPVAASLAAARSKRGPRGQEAREVAKRGRRGLGRKLSDAELLTYVAGVRAAHPDASASDELEYAYWIEKLAVTRQRFMAAWSGSLGTTKTEPATPGKAEPEPATPGKAEPVPAKRRGAKAAPAKKAATPRKRAAKAAKVA